MLQNTKSRIIENIDKGKILKDYIKKSKSLSVGIIFKAELRLEKTVFDIHKENLREKKRGMNEKMKNKDEKSYHENVPKAKAVFETNKRLDKMTINELTTFCKPLKRKEDGKKPKKNQ